jgi:hypothetical protein
MHHGRHLAFAYAVCHAAARQFLEIEVARLRELLVAGKYQAALDTVEPLLVDYPSIAIS